MCFYVDIKAVTIKSFFSDVRMYSKLQGRQTVRKWSFLLLLFAVKHRLEKEEKNAVEFNISILICNWIISISQWDVLHTFVKLIQNLYQEIYSIYIYFLSSHNVFFARQQLQSNPCCVKRVIIPALYRERTSTEEQNGKCCLCFQLKNIYPIR